MSIHSQASGNPSRLLQQGKSGQDVGVGQDDSFGQAHYRVGLQQQPGR
jgi:hypothetical protein